MCFRLLTHLFWYSYPWTSIQSSLSFIEDAIPYSIVAIFLHFSASAHLHKSFCLSPFPLFLISSLIFKLGLILAFLPCLLVIPCFSIGFEWFLLFLWVLSMFYIVQTSHSYSPHLRSSPRVILFSYSSHWSSFYAFNLIILFPFDAFILNARCLFNSILSGLQSCSLLSLLSQVIVLTLPLPLVPLFWLLTLYFSFRKHQGHDDFF